MQERAGLNWPQPCLLLTWFHLTLSSRAVSATRRVVTVLGHQPPKQYLQRAVQAHGHFVEPLFQSARAPSNTAGAVTIHRGFSCFLLVAAPRKFDQVRCCLIKSSWCVHNGFLHKTSSIMALLPPPFQSMCGCNTAEDLPQLNWCFDSPELPFVWPGLDGHAGQLLMFAHEQDGVSLEPNFSHADLSFQGHFKSRLAKLHRSGGLDSVLDCSPSVSRACSSADVGFPSWRSHGNSHDCDGAALHSGSCWHCPNYSSRCLPPVSSGSSFADDFQQIGLEKPARSSQRPHSATHVPSLASVGNGCASSVRSCSQADCRRCSDFGQLETPS